MTDFWWESKRNDAHKKIFDAVHDIDQNQSYHYDDNRHYLQLYSNRDVDSLSGRGYLNGSNGQRLHWNLIQSVIDTMLSHLGTNRPKPMFLGEGANYSTKRRALGLTKFCDGMFYALKQYETSLQIALDAFVFGTGIQKVIAGETEIASERVFPDEFIVDDIDGRLVGPNCGPRCVYQYKDVPREVLAHRFPKYRDEIYAADWSRRREGTLSSYGMTGLSTRQDPVSTIEAYHLPSGKDAKDGRKTWCISNATFVDDKWERDHFPYAVYRWAQRPLGFRGRGLAEELESIQVELQYTLEKIQEAFTLAAPQIWVAKGSGVNVSGLTNQIGAVYEFNGTPPIFNNPQAIGGDVIAHAESLWQRGFEIAGITVLSATGQKPAGLNSGESLRVYNDTGSKRFQAAGQRWESFHMNVAELMIEAARDMGPDYSVMAKGDRDVQMIKFKDVDLDRDKYVMQVFPINFLPDTPSGKLDTIRDAADINPEVAGQMLEALQFPDTEKIFSQHTAQANMCDRLIEEMLEKGKYRPPESFMALDLFIKRMGPAILNADMDGVADQKIDLVRQFVTEAQEMLLKSQEVAAPPPAPGPAELGPLPGELPPMPGMELGAPPLPPELAPPPAPPLSELPV